MRKKILSIALAGVLSASVIAGSAMTANAAGTGVLPVYEPGADVEVRTYYFATPGQWVNDETKKAGNPAGLYWWDGTDTPGDNPANGGQGWPGYKLADVEEEGVENLHKALCPKDAPTIIFDNYFDGGMDTTDPNFWAAKQGVDERVEFWLEGDSAYYPQYWWDYMYEIYDQNPDDPDFSAFGKYASNFFDEKVYGSGLATQADNMVYVVDLRPETMTISKTIVPEGMPTYEGAFYFYYGGGKYGIWPTEDLAKEQEGLVFDEEGNVDTTKLPENCKIDEWGSVVRTFEGKDYVIYGNFTGKYWQDNTPAPIPTADPNATTVPAPAATDATGSTSAGQSGNSSNSTSTNSANGAVATGEASVAVIAFVVIVAGLGVFYFTRKKYNK